MQHCREIIHKNTNNNPEAIAGVFADYFQNFINRIKVIPLTIQHQKISNNFILISLKHVKTSLINYLVALSIRMKLERLYKQLKRRKAGSHDNIQNEHLIFGGDKYVKCVTTLFNIIIKQGSIQNDWENGIIVPIYKGNDKPKTLPDSYRPISLLPCEAVTGQLSSYQSPAL